MELVLNFPAVCLVLGLFAILAFRSPLARLIDRTTKVTKDGATFERAQEPPEAPPKQVSFEQLMKEPVSVSILQREDSIRQALDQFELKTDQERITVLIRALGKSRVESEFHNASHIIYGSQLGLLVHIAGTPTGVTLAEATTLFETAQAQFPELHAGRSLQDWLKYLELAGFATVIGETIDITQYGTDFLKYLLEARLAHERYG